MTCADWEIWICDYVDGTLPPERKSALEEHLAGCTGCAELARDSATAVAFMERAAAVEPPPELMTRIVFEASRAQRRHPGSGSLLRWLRGLFHPLLQPRLAMGMAMTILFVSMLAQFVAPVRHLEAADLAPAKVWAALDDLIYRTWQRTVKFYENIRFIYQIQTRLREWQRQQDEEERLAAPEQDQRRLPARNRTSGAQTMEQAK